MTLHDNNNYVHDTHNIEGVLLHMGFQDYAAQHNIELYENDNAQYERVSRMYISKNTREGYQICMKIFLLFLDDNNPECVSDYLFLLVWPPRFQSLLIKGWCCSIPEHRL